MKAWELIPAILLCCVLIAQPVFAQTVSIEAPEGQAIRFLTIGSDEGTEGTITFHFNDGTSMDGSWSYLTSFSVGGYSTVRVGKITIGGETAETTYITMGKFYNKYMQTKAMINASNNIIRGAYGQIDGGWYNYVEKESPSSPIIGIDFTSDTDVSYKVEYESLSSATENVSGGLLEWIDRIMGLAYSSFWFAYHFVESLVYWLKFFFIDNLLMVVTLYIAVTMVFAARKAHGRMDIFFRTFFNDQKKLFSFIMDVWKMLIESIGTIRGWFRI